MPIANAKLLNVSILFLDNMVLMALLGSTRLQCASKAALESVIACNSHHTRS